MDVMQLTAILNDLEQELRRLQLWGGPEYCPEREALASALPFCLDTLQFHEWLEYVLIFRLRELIVRGGALPERLAVHPLAEELYRGQLPAYHCLLEQLRRLDRLFAAPEPELASGAVVQAPAGSSPASQLINSRNPARSAE